ncbi:MAG: Unknown protein [uncultured Sulfurovum sp.]|uniref:Uncharacterized protein n=1 Tax=uncultured Sulfurovum sp. TaxID=269237 RepID=A0A6S6SRM9_9BACT|nr:MAG: Unknown protein [uncultured Sulfurovum sp.]
MVIIESVIKSNAMGRWYIELSDTFKEMTPENRVICVDIHDYAQKVEQMGSEYGEEVQVAWSSADGVTVEQIHEVRQQIMAYEAEIEASTQK